MFSSRAKGLTRLLPVTKNHRECPLPLMAKLFLLVTCKRQNVLKSHSQERGKELVLLSPRLTNKIKTSVKQRES